MVGEIAVEGHRNDEEKPEGLVHQPVVPFCAAEDAECGESYHDEPEKRVLDQVHHEEVVRGEKLCFMV